MKQSLQIMSVRAGKISKEMRLDLLLLAAVGCLAILVLPLGGVGINNNSAKYLQQANDILHGQAPEMLFKDLEVTRGPFYPLILASAFKSFGKSVHVASLATRAFFALGAILIFLLGRMLYGRRVGVLASFLVLSSYGVNQPAASIDTDIVLPCFILLFLVTYYISSVRTNCLWALGSGVCLALALMVKESAFLYLGVPIGLIILAESKKRRANARLLLFVIIGCVISLIPWAIQTFRTHGTLLPMLGVFHANVQRNLAVDHGMDSAWFYWTYMFTVGLGKSLTGYYKLYLNQTSPLAGLMVCGGAFVLIRGLIYKRTNDLLLVLSLVCFLPVVIRIGYFADSRLGQTAVIYMLLDVALSVAIVSGLEFAVNRLTPGPGTARQRAVVSGSIIVPIGVALLALQLFVSGFPYSIGGTARFWTTGGTPLAVFSKAPFQVHGRFTAKQEQAAEWLKMNTPYDSIIIADGYSREALEFFDVRKGRIPVFHPKESVVIADWHVASGDERQRPVYLFTHSKFTRGGYHNRSLWIIFEDDIMQALRQYTPDYVVISARGLFMQAYFNNASWAELKYENSEVRVYQINLSDFECVNMDDIGVNDALNSHLAWLKEKFPVEYNLFLKNLAMLDLSLPDLENSRCRFPVGQIY